MDHNYERIHRKVFKRTRGRESRQSHKLGNAKSLDPNGVHRIWQEKKRLKEKSRCSRFRNQFKRYYEKSADDPNDIELQKQYATCKKSLETEQLAKTRGAIVRARV